MQGKLITMWRRKNILIENLSLPSPLCSSVLDQNHCTFNHKISPPFVVFFGWDLLSCLRFYFTAGSSELKVSGYFLFYLLDNYSSWCKRQESGMEFWSSCDPCERVSSAGGGKREFTILCLRLQFFTVMSSLLFLLLKQTRSHVRREKEQVSAKSAARTFVKRFLESTSSSTQCFVASSKCLLV